MLTCLLGITMDAYCVACRLFCRRVVGHNEQLHNIIIESIHVAIEEKSAPPCDKNRSCV